MFSMPEVDDHWAAVFDSSAAELWRAGVAVTPHKGHLQDYLGVSLFKRLDACRISAPLSLVEPLRQKIEHLDARVGVPGRNAAASNLTGWRKGADRPGVVTRPDRRGRGHGTAAAAAATAAALETTTVAEWRARGTNTPSIRTALRLGFAHYGENLAVRLR